MVKINKIRKKKLFIFFFFFLALSIIGTPDAMALNALNNVNGLTLEAWVNFRTLGSTRTIICKRLDHTHKIQLSLDASGCN